MKIPKDQLSYLIFSEVYQKLEIPKAKRAALSIVETAISCFYKKGWAGVTMTMVARESGIKRQSLSHYFSTLEELREVSIKYIRLVFQKEVVDKIGNETNPEKMIEIYVQSCFEWVEDSKVHAVVWLSFIHSCTSHEGDRNLNTEAVKVGTERIAYILNLGVEKNIFPQINVIERAQMIQVLIMGAMIAYAAQSFDDHGKNFIKNTQQSLKILLR